MDINHTLPGRWLNGVSVPVNENVIKLGNKLGFAIYDLLEWIRPKEK